ncbi:membrane associated rhomboid family serine protease [Bradyrhizobium japonicum]
MDSPQDSPPEPPAAVEEAPREPILTLPIALTAYILLLAVIHLRVLLPPELENWTIDVFGFIPKRYDSSLLNLQIPGGAGAKVWTFVTYSLLHANLTHLGFNVLWLLPFGSALARRFGAIRFFLFLAVTAAAGALAHLVTHEHAVAPMIGASASVSGAMAAAIRFAFVRGSFLSFNRSDADTAARVPALPLSRALRDGRGWSGSSPFGSASTSSSASARSASIPKPRASPGRRISAASSRAFCCSRCSIPCRACETMLRMRHHRTFQTAFEAALAAPPEFIHHFRQECSEATSR